MCHYLMQPLSLTLFSLNFPSRFRPEVKVLEEERSHTEGDGGRQHLLSVSSTHTHSSTEQITNVFSPPKSSLLRSFSWPGGLLTHSSHSLTAFRLGPWSGVYSNQSKHHPGHLSAQSLEDSRRGRTGKGLTPPAPTTLACHAGESIPYQMPVFADPLAQPSRRHLSSSRSHVYVSTLCLA